MAIKLGPSTSGLWKEEIGDIATTTGLTLYTYTIHLHYTGLNGQMENLTFCPTTTDVTCPTTTEVACPTTNGDKPREKEILFDNEGILRAVASANKVFVFTNSNLSNTTFN